MVRRVVRFLLERGGEMLLAVGLVLASFLVFMAILSLSLPRGTGLLDLMRSGEPSGEEGGPEAGEDGTGPGEAGDGGGPLVAVLSHISRDVKDKASDAIAWTPSREGMRLGDRHSVQTFDDSRATLTFSEDNELMLEENTLVVLKKAEPLTPRNRRLATLIVVGGELRGTIAVPPGAPVSVQIEAATQVASILSDAGAGAPAEFSVRVNEDASSTFTVFQGRAEVSSEQGSLVVPPNHSVTVAPGGSIGPPQELPPPPELLEPENGARLTFRESRSRMHFAWKGAGEGDAYVLAVARDPGFRDLVSSEPLPNPGFTLGNLRAGAYYWRVSTRRGRAEGPPSPTRRFLIARDLEEPELRVEFPGRVVSASEIVLTGSAEPGTRIFVNNEEITVAPSGRFSHAVALQRGVNVVVVEAIDPAGNVAYRSETIDALY